eukprot:TRINITY_DN48361_c0_g1_i1.p1 TRINITY_DN48361_c0_g1~~TRINITY_DN48361_c0_g1_i1.p1  ORF type:complete len:531 (+),score=156.70 TRINITY_DN48361_c0_g1_i1:125-1594(+)
MEVDKHPRWLARMAKLRGEDSFPTLSPPPRTRRDPSVDLINPGAPSSTSAPEPPKQDAAREDPVAAFDLRPREVFDHLDRYVIGQSHAKQALSIAICDHYMHARACIENPDVAAEPWTKPNVLLLGPTGVGKTHLLRVITRLIGVPLVVADATKLSATGYVGGDAEDCIRNLVAAAGGNVVSAQHGVVFLDEVDKIAQPRNAAASAGAGVNTREVQNSLLKLMEDGTVHLSTGSGTSAGVKRAVSTKHILFIASGAFNALRTGVQEEGAGSVPTTALVEAGLEPEFVGRLPVRVGLHSLSESDLVQVLRNAEHSVLRQMTSQFARYGVSVEWTDEALHTIAQRASAEGTGARGLVTVLELALSPFKMALPSSSVRSIEITPRFIDDPTAALADILSGSDQRSVLRDDVKRFARGFERQTGRALHVTDAVRDAAVDAAVATGRTVHYLLWRGCGDALLRRHKEDPGWLRTEVGGYAPISVTEQNCTLPDS